MRGYVYRAVQRAMHRFDLHHTTRIGPMEDGRTLHRCSWCGASRTHTPYWVTEREMLRRQESNR